MTVAELIEQLKALPQDAPVTIMRDTVLNEAPVRTTHGLEYVVKFDANPEARAASGTIGGAMLAVNRKIKPGLRVALQYISASSYGLWFIVDTQ